MSTIPARILRAQADMQPSARRYRSARERDEEDHILRGAKPILARNGRANLNFGGLAFALRISVGLLRRHFPDLDSLLGEILLRHLREISEALGKIPQDAPNCQAARRAAYLAATRTQYGDPNEAQMLLLRDRHALPADLAEPIETIRQSIGDLLAYPNGPLALALLDTPGTDPSTVEAMFAAILPAASPAPAPLPEAASPPKKAVLTGTTALARLAPMPLPTPVTLRPLAKFPARAGP
jgi:AcrR family transcriptional regulator